MVLRSCWKSRHKSGRRATSCRWFGPGLAALLCLFVTQLGCGVGASGLAKNVTQKYAEFDVTYNDTVTSDNQTIYAFNHTVSRNKVSSCGWVCVCVCQQHRSHSGRYDIYNVPRRCSFSLTVSVWLWMCCHKVLTAPSCLLCDRSKLCCPSKSLLYSEACEYLSIRLSIHSLCVHDIP